MEMEQKMNIIMIWVMELEQKMDLILIWEMEMGQKMNHNDIENGASKYNKYRIIIILVGINYILFNFLIILINNFIYNNFIYFIKTKSINLIIIF